MWFHLPVRSRRWIAVLLNLGWIAHFTTLGCHLYYYTYAQGNSWPGKSDRRHCRSGRAARRTNPPFGGCCFAVAGILANNLPFAFSILAPMAGGIIQGVAEDHVIRKDPSRFPPRWLSYLKSARRKWIEQGRKGSFIAYVRAELGQFKEDSAFFKQLATKNGVRVSSYALTGIAPASPNSPTKSPSSASPSTSPASGPKSKSPADGRRWGSRRARSPHSPPSGSPTRTRKDKFEDVPRSVSV